MTNTIDLKCNAKNIQHRVKFEVVQYLKWLQSKQNTVLLKSTTLVR